MSGFIREVFYELYCTVTTPYLHFYFFAHQVLIFLPGATFETGTRSHSVGSHCTPQLSSVLNACWKQLAIVASFTRCRCQALSIQGRLAIHWWLTLAFSPLVDGVSCALKNKLSVMELETSNDTLIHRLSHCWCYEGEFQLDGLQSSNHWVCWTIVHKE